MTFDKLLEWDPGKAADQTLQETWDEHPGKIIQDDHELGHELEDEFAIPVQQKLFSWCMPRLRYHQRCSQTA